MGKLKGNQFGVFTGKLGGVVGFYKDNQYLVRAYQPTVFNPKSSAQITQRKIFKEIITSLSPIWGNVTAKYGTYKGSAFSKMSKYALNTLFAKTTGAIETDKGFVVKNWSNSMFDLIAKSYDNNGLNVFNPRYISLKNTGTEESPIIKPYNLLGDINTLSGGIGFFGCDYLLPEYIGVIIMNNEGNFIQSPNDSGLGLQEQRLNPEGPKNLGFYSNIDNVGSGWKYVYKTGNAPIVFPGFDDNISTLYGINVEGTKKTYASTTFLCFGYSTDATANRITCISSAMLTQEII